MHDSGRGVVAVDSMATVVAGAAADNASAWSLFPGPGLTTSGILPLQIPVCQRKRACGFHMVRIIQSVASIQPTMSRDFSFPCHALVLPKPTYEDKYETKHTVSTKLDGVCGMRWVSLLEMFHYLVRWLFLQPSRPHCTATNSRRRPMDKTEDTAIHPFLC